MVNTYTTVSIIIFIALNIVSFVLMGADKLFAKKGGRRISERTLLLFAFFMGGTGIILGSAAFSHKTRKLKFKVPMILAFIINLLVVFAIIRACK